MGPKCHEAKPWRDLTAAKLCSRRGSWWMHKPRGPGVSAWGDPPTNRCTRAPPSSFHAAFCVKGTPAVVHLDGLNHVQPELRRRHSLRESRKGPGTHMHEPPPSRESPGNQAVSKQHQWGEKRTQELGQGSASALPRPLDDLGGKARGGRGWWSRGGEPS